MNSLKFIRTNKSRSEDVVSRSQDKRAYRVQLHLHIPAVHNLKAKLGKQLHS